MTKTIRMMVMLVVLAPTLANAGSTLPALAAKNPGKKLAIVSLSANNFGNSLQGWNTSLSSELMGSRMNKMLGVAETVFANDWVIVKASTFVKKPEYQKLAGAEMEVGLPVIDGSPMPLLAENRKELIKTRMSSDKAKALTQLTGADFVMIVYSEWGVATGRFVPTSKALTKNVIGVYDAKGDQVYFGRSDKNGKKTLGSMGSVVVDENSIDEWVNAFEQGLTALSQGRK